MQNQRLRQILFLALILLVAMVALAFHIGAQRPEEAELIVPAADITLTQPVTIYVYDARLDTDASGNVLCSEKGVVPVPRSIPKTETPLRAAIELLLSDPLTEDERARGLTSEFPLQGVRLDDVAISGGTATIVLRDPDHKLSGGSCRVGVMRAQLAATAKEFKDVEEVRFAPEGVLEP